MASVPASPRATATGVPSTKSTRNEAKSARASIAFSQRLDGVVLRRLAAAPDADAVPDGAPDDGGREQRQRQRIDPLRLAEAGRGDLETVLVPDHLAAEHDQEAEHRNRREGREHLGDAPALRRQEVGKPRDADLA